MRKAQHLIHHIGVDIRAEAIGTQNKPQDDIPTTKHHKGQSTLVQLHPQGGRILEHTLAPSRGYIGHHHGRQKRIKSLFFDSLYKVLKIKTALIILECIFFHLLIKKLDPMRYPLPDSSFFPETIICPFVEDGHISSHKDSTSPKEMGVDERWFFPLDFCSRIFSFKSIMPRGSIPEKGSSRNHKTFSHRSIRHRPGQRTLQLTLGEVANPLASAVWTDTH